MFGIGNRHLGAAHPYRWRIQLIEPLFHDARHDLGRDAAAAPALVHDHHPMGLGRRCQNSGLVQWTQAAQVDHLSLDPVGRELIGRAHRLVKAGAVGQYRHIRAHAMDASLINRRCLRLGGHPAVQVVEHHVLEDQDRIRIGQRRGEHVARILHRRRGQHLEAGNVGIPAFQAVGMLGGELLARAGGHADHDGHAELPARHVPQGSGVVHDLVQRQQAEVDRHDLDDGAHAAERCADAGTHET